MRIYHAGTGEGFWASDDPVSRSRYRFQVKCKALERFRDEKGYRVYFVTLTLANEEVDTANCDLHKFLDFLAKRFKRAGVPWRYVWTVELQRKRYQRTGVAALHWHFAIACPEGALPDVQYVKSAHWHYQVKRDGEIVGWKDLVGGWGRGQVFSMLAWSRGVLRYLGKYMSKEYEKLDGYNVSWGKLRRFGSSQFGALAYPAWAREAVADRESEGVDGLTVRKEGGRVNWYARDASNQEVVVLSSRSPWRVSPSSEAPEAGSAAAVASGGP